MRVIFKDGNKRNFDPCNLELTTREEISARAFAQFLSCPEPIRVAIKLTRKLQREVQRHRERKPKCEGAGRTKMRRSMHTRWSEDMDLLLRREYPTKPIDMLITKLRVSRQSIRNRARRLGIRRLPETIIAEACAAAATHKARALEQGDTHAE